MRKLILPALLALSACTGTPSINTVSTQTVISADSIYTAASIAGAALVKAGKLDATRFHDLDNQAYATLLDVRAGKATIDELAALTDALKGGQ